MLCRTVRKTVQQARCAAVALCSASQRQLLVIWLIAAFFFNPSVARSGVVSTFHAKSNNGCRCNHHRCIVDCCFVVVVTLVVTVAIVNSQRLRFWHHCRWPASMLGFLLSLRSLLDNFLRHCNTSIWYRGRDESFARYLY